MKAILYVAGRGMRLGARAQDRPKVLLSIGGRTLLDRHFENLTRAGVKELALVTGFQRDVLLEELLRLQTRYAIAVREYENPCFTEGSVLSFHAALAELEDLRQPVLLMDGDVLYPAEMLKRLMHSRHPTALLVDREYGTDDDDPVLVPIKDGRPIDFVKQWQGQADAFGESVGFFKVDPVDAPLVMASTKRRVAEGRRGDSYDDVLREMVQTGRFGHEDVTGMPWTEIDFPEDVQRAENEVLPEIERAWS